MSGRVDVKVHRSPSTEGPEWSLLVCDFSQWDVSFDLPGVGQRETWNELQIQVS